MENMAINKLMGLIEVLSLEDKLILLTKLSEILKTEVSTSLKGKELLLQELSGSWRDTDDNLSSEILEARSISESKTCFD